MSALQKENIDGNFSVLNEQCGSRGYGPRPHEDMGTTHKLICRAWNVGTIEKIYAEEDDDLIYTFLTLCVSYTCGRRKWNTFSTTMPLEKFITPSDEAFAMLTLENNAAKWIDELYLKATTKKERRKALYTEEVTAKRWSLNGMTRYCEIHKAIMKFRSTKDGRWKTIESMVKDREIGLRGIKQGGKRKRVDMEDEIEMGDGVKTERESTMEYMVKMANGGDLMSYIQDNDRVEM